MARHQRLKSKSGYYHIMIRGNERKNIFHDEEDKLRFLKTLYERQQGNRFLLHAFCLMDNHVHLMLSEGIEDVATVMKRINVSYVYYFNKKYKRVGHLFQDRFKSEVVEDDNYVLALARYIHRNPVKAGTARSVKEYKWSSYACYLDENHYFGKIVEVDTILGLFSASKPAAKSKFEQYMEEGTTEVFIDLTEEEEEMDEEAASKFFEMLIEEREYNRNSDIKMQLTSDLIREFKAKTRLSIRKISAVTGLNKDKVNKMLNS